MAGSRPDYPGNRMPIDDDGTVLYRTNRAGVMDSTAASTLNYEAAASVSFWPAAGAGSGSTGYLTVVFPELRDVVGWYLRLSNLATGVIDDDDVEYATDTSTGDDGTWTSASTAWGVVGSDTAASSSWRDDVVTSQPLRCNGLRFAYSGAENSIYLSNLHLFGERVTHGDRLVVYDFDGKVRVLPRTLDWGDVPLASAADFRIRVKNTSASLIADSMLVTLEPSTDTTPSVPAQHLLSYDLGDTFAASVSIGRVEPGDVTGPIIVRRVTSASVTAGPWAARIRVTASGWTFADPTGASVAVAAAHPDACDYILEGDVGVGDPTPVVWWTNPATAKAGDTVVLVGYGLGDTQGAASVTVTDTNEDPVLVTPDAWTGVAPTGDALTDARAQSKAADTSDPVHQRITLTVPSGAQTPVCSIVVDTG